MHPVGESVLINAPISINNAVTSLHNTGHCPLVNTGISSPAPATTCKKTRDPAKALEKAVENKATEYGFDSDTIKLRAYANAREKGIPNPSISSTNSRKSAVNTQFTPHCPTGFRKARPLSSYLAKPAMTGSGLGTRKLQRNTTFSEGHTMTKTVRSGALLLYHLWAANP